MGRKQVLQKLDAIDQKVSKGHPQARLLLMKRASLLGILTFLADNDFNLQF